VRMAGKQLTTIYLTRAFHHTKKRHDLSTHYNVLVGSGFPTDGSLAEVQGVISIVGTVMDAAVIDSMPRLKVIAKHGAGYNEIDVTHAAKKGIWVTNTPGVVGAPTADIAIAHILNTSRLIPQSERSLREKQTTTDGWSTWMGHSVEGKNLGIFGLGSIGKQVAKRATGFDMRIYYNNRNRLPEAEEQSLGVTYLPKDELLAISDFIVLSMPSTAQTIHFLGQPEFEKMKDGVYVINVARGKLIDEVALTANLKSGKVSGAGLDVFEFEPQVHPDLFELPNVTLTPHIGTATYEVREIMEDLTLANLEAVLRGEKPLTPVPECVAIMSEAGQ